MATDLGVDLIAGTEQLEETRAVAPPVPEDAAECLRIESGRPRLGLDMDGSTIPQEAGLNDRAVSFTKGCYVGQETVARLHYRGKPNRGLRGLRLTEPARPWRRHPRSASAQVGTDRLGLRLPHLRADRPGAGAARGGRWRRGVRGRLARHGHRAALRASVSQRRRPSGRGGLSEDSPLLGGTLTVGAGAEEPRAPEPEWDPRDDELGLPQPEPAAPPDPRDLRELIPARDPGRSLDDWGRSERVFDLIEPLLDFYYRYWFRVEAEGVDNVPAEGGALLVSNHSGALPPTRR